jgi:uncharacterized repeat protein (TIGR01451 family)
VNKRVLYFIVVLALVLCMTLPMTTPVMASQISGTKNTIPALPNMYRIGDTIYYVMTVTNPVSNTANNTLTRIWDTLPNGTVIDFLDPGETLVQAPGNTTTFYGNYTVATVDVVWLPGPAYHGVKNTFEAQGYDSAGGDVYVRVTKNSQIIEPAIDVEKYVWDGSGWQDADTATGPYLPSTQNPVVFRFDIDNTGDADLTNVSLTDTDMMTFYTDQACTSLAVFPIPILYDDDPIVTVYGKLTFAPGQHSNSVTVTGTPPVGAPVSDSDPAYYFGSGASIDLEKAVWDGVTWQDADIATGPYLVSGPVVFRFVITNNGNVDLTNVTLTDTDMSAFYTDQACTSLAGFPTSLAMGQTKTYYGKLAWAEGQHSNSATAAGTPPVGAPVSDSDPAHYFGPGPSIDVEKAVWDGSTWHDADTAAGPSLTVAQNPVVFRFVISNNGNVDLISVNLTDTDISAFYTDQACTSPASFPTTLAVNETKTYYGSRAWAQGQQTDVASVSGIPPVGAPVFTDTDPANYFGSPSSIDVEKAVWDGATWDDADSPTGPLLTAAHNPVVFRFVITNNYGVNLTSVNLTDTDISAFYIDQGCTILAAFPIPTMPTSASVTVYGSLPWAEGQHSNNATATGTPPVGAPISDSDPAHYFGSPPAPAIDIEKHTNGEDADYAPGPYISANSTVTWAYIVTNIGDVDLTGIVVTDDKLGLIGTIPSLVAGATQTLYAYATATAGQYANNATVVGDYGAAEVTDWDLSHYYNHLPTVGWKTYPVNKSRVLLPWIGLIAAIFAGASLLTLRHRRRKGSADSV